MTIWELINYYVDIIMWSTLGIMALGVAGLYYVLKVKKFGSKIEQIDYSNFDRKDSMEYVKFDDILSEEDAMKTPGIISLGYNVFVAGIDIVGYNFASASAEARRNTMVNAINFSNVIEEPIQMRQTVKAVDLSHNIEQHEDILNHLYSEYQQLTEECEHIVRTMDDYLDVPDKYNVLQEKRKRLGRTIYYVSHSITETRLLLQYMHSMESGTGADAQKINQIMFDYVFNPAEYTQELTQEEIYLKAFDALETKASSYINALSACGCTCRRLTGMELVGLMRKHMHPLSSEEISIEDLFDSSYNALFISSDSLIDLEIARIGEEAYRQQAEKIRAEREAAIMQQQQEAARRAQRINEDAEQQARSIILASM